MFNTSLFVVLTSTLASRLMKVRLVWMDLGVESPILWRGLTSHECCITILTSRSGVISTQRLSQDFVCLRV